MRPTSAPISGPGRCPGGRQLLLRAPHRRRALDDVDFAYEEGKTILHDITLFAKPGQKLAFVGATARARPPSPT